MASNTILVFCPQCNASLRAPSVHIGKTGKCRKCGASVLIRREGDREVPQPPPPVNVSPSATQPVPPPPFPPTAKQNDFAESLGIEGAAGMTRWELSKKITEAKSRQFEADCERLDEMETRGSRAYIEHRADVVAHMAETDPQISVATPQQIVNALDDEGVIGVLVTLQRKDVTDFSELAGVNIGISFPDEIFGVDLIDVLLAATNKVRKAMKDINQKRRKT